MRLANHEGRAVVVTGDIVGVDVAAASDGRFAADVAPLYDVWDEFAPWAAGLGASGRSTVTLDPALLGPPSPRPRQVFGIGLNYRAHAAETGQEVPRIPATFNSKY